MHSNILKSIRNACKTFFSAYRQRRLSRSGKGLPILIEQSCRQKLDAREGMPLILKIQSWRRRYWVDGDLRLIGYWRRSLHTSIRNMMMPNGITGTERVKYEIPVEDVSAYLLYPTSSGCEFPAKWTGTWFQKGVHPPIKIEKDIFSLKGKCLSADAHMFYIEDKNEKCYRCVVIYEKHPNVLQYRETYCDGFKSLHQACSTINADAPLYSLFRMDSNPVPCQLKGPFIFTYNRGHGECQDPMSTIDSCTDDSKLLFRFQACADVKGTESSVEELSCHAVWKEGSYHYLVGKMANEMHHNLPFTDDNAYRCFVFDFLSDKGGIQMSQSSDATCDGLISPWEGSRTMRLYKSKHPTPSCQFPPWATNTHKWHTLDSRRVYKFSPHNNTFRVSHFRDTHHLDARFLCIEEVDTSMPNSSTYIAYSMSGCKNGFVCMKIYKRNNHVIEIQFGDMARSKQEACNSAFSDMYTNKEFVTLIAHSATPSSCPQLVDTNGIRVQSGKVTSFRPELCRDLNVQMVGCQSNDAIEFLTSCQSITDIQSFHCHGDWEENGKSYLITGMRNSKNKFCFVYWSNDKTTHLSGIHDTCRRSIEPGVTGNFTFHISSAGMCDTLLSHSPKTRSPHAMTALLKTILLFLLSKITIR
ncbi:hypothetical protein JTE90_001152 [Oedothorax gibbosus]|uniref:Uncharacterized protein n=1 Tax=Oedothorax gibbosus TaxID=931172 RepID=A0AAV6VJP8_9ARAC|nr:hypothetical protein JTE90_001152 [Oedothorax gibbosus]